MSAYRAGKRASEDQKTQWQMCGAGSSPAADTMQNRSSRIFRRVLKDDGQMALVVLEYKKAVLQRQVKSIFCNHYMEGYASGQSSVAAATMMNRCKIRLERVRQFESDLLPPS